MAEEKENDTSSNAVLIILGLAGLGVIATAMILVYRMAQARLAHPYPQPFLPGPAGQPILDFDTQLALPAPAYSMRKQMADTRTYSVQRDSPVRVATSYSDRATVVTMRAVHPPGAWAAVATSMAVAQQMSSDFPTGSMIVLPVGGAPQDIMLSPGEALFAKASQDNVLVSISTAEAQP